ncbi:MAG: signal peptidase I [Defluviitaleaceae bacterium]|nr:signal peptidase I [Defluviitaleaceae bacterium]
MSIAKKVVGELVVWGMWLGIGIVASVLLNNHVLVNAQVLTGSMEGTIMTQSRVFGLRAGFMDAPSRGDIIVFESPLPDEFDEPFIKRVIALGGEEIAIVGGIVHIDGVPLPESYLAEDMRRDFAPVVVPEGTVFVMGDNRNYSRDSREWGAICKDSIIGRIYLDFSPLPAIVANYNYK